MTEINDGGTRYGLITCNDGLLLTNSYLVTQPNRPHDVLKI